MGAAKTPSGAECDRIAPDVRARALLAVAIRHESAAPTFEASGLQQHGAGYRTWCRPDQLPESRIWTCGRAAPIYFERSSVPDGGGRGKPTVSFAPSRSATKS